MTARPHRPTFLPSSPLDVRALTIVGSEVRFRGQIGKHLLTASLSAFDPNRSLASQTCCDAQGAADLTVWYRAKLAGDSP